MNSVPIALLATALLAAPMPVLAHILDAPEEVQADATGAFSYTFDIIIEAPGALLDGWSWLGIENVEFGLIADCFCAPICDYDEGEIITAFVDGILVDPAAPGLVENGVEFCDAPPLHASTTILPAVVAVPPVDHTAISAVSSRPNPLRTRTSIEYGLDRPGRVRVTIHDVAGRLVETLHDGYQSAGRHAATWIATGDGHASPAPGTYFAVIETAGARVTTKLQLIP